MTHSILFLVLSKVFFFFFWWLFIYSVLVVAGLKPKEKRNFVPKFWFSSSLRAGLEMHWQLRGQLSLCIPGPAAKSGKLHFQVESLLPGH